MVLATYNGTRQNYRSPYLEVQPMYIQVYKPIYLDINGPFQSSCKMEGETCVCILNIPQQKKIKEKPPNHFQQMSIGFSLNLCNTILQYNKAAINADSINYNYYNCDHNNYNTPGGRRVKLKNRPMFLR